MSRTLRIAAVLTLVLAVRAASPPPATAEGVAWGRPVAGAVVRAFTYAAAEPFVRGLHRGVDLAGTPGATVRAACGGSVVTAQPGQVVTLRCGPWRVTHLPMSHIAVHVGERVAPGDRLGSLGSSGEHRGLHLGVRRAGDPFGYVDPLAFLPRARAPRLPPTLPAPRDRERPHRLAPPPPASTRRPSPRPAARRFRVTAPSGLRYPAPHLSGSRSPTLAGAHPAGSRSPTLAGAHPAGSRSPTLAPLHPRGLSPHSGAPLGSSRVPARAIPGVRVSLRSGIAPWPAWAGLLLVLCGGLGGGVRWRVRARRVPAPARRHEGVA